jgi:DNA-directed RNA polymerase specialized sigma24 family protein
MATRTERAKRAERRAEILSGALDEGSAALRLQADRHAPAWADPGDALQDACVAFLRYYDGPPGRPALRYLMLAVKHSAWALGTEAARRRADPAELTTTDAFDPDRSLVRILCERPGPAERAERSERVRSAASRFADLKRDERTALLLLGLGYSYAEIAAHRSWTRTKLNRCLSEGRAALRALGEGGRDPAADRLEG